MKLTEKQQAVYAALKAHGGWASAWDMSGQGCSRPGSILTALVKNGFAEKRSSWVGFNRYIITYRAIEVPND